MGAPEDWFQVHEAGLKQFAKATESRAQELNQYVQQAKQLAVSPDAFGHIPYIGDRIYQAYHDHVTATVDGLSAAARTEGLTGQVLMASVAAYEAAEAANLHLEHELHLEHQHAEHERHLQNQPPGGSA